MIQETVEACGDPGKGTADASLKEPIGCVSKANRNRQSQLCGATQRGLTIVEHTAGLEQDEIIAELQPLTNQYWGQR